MHLRHVLEADTILPHQLLVHEHDDVVVLGIGAGYDEIVAACRRAGLTLNERHFQQLCATAPYVEAMVGRLRGDPEFYEEPASIVCFRQTIR